jgi:hypothetical protein
VIDILRLGMYADNGGRQARDVMPERGERARREAWFVHRVMQRMQQKLGGIRHAGTLFRVYGPQHWRAPHGHFKPAELAPIIEDTPFIAAMLEMTPSLSKSAAVEHVLRSARKNGNRVVQRLEREASDLLTVASLAYNEALDAELAEKRLARTRLDDALRKVA